MLIVRVLPVDRVFAFATVEDYLKSFEQEMDRWELWNRIDEEVYDVGIGGEASEAGFLDLTEQRRIAIRKQSDKLLASQEIAT
jgi:hypothetical protein